MANAVCHIITRRLCTLEGQALRCARFSVSPLRHYPHITRDHWRRFKAHERAGLCQHGAHAAPISPTTDSLPRRQPTAFRVTGLRGGSIKSLQRMCKREQTGDDLRRAVRDLAHHLDATKLIGLRSLGECREWPPTAFGRLQPLRGGGRHDWRTRRLLGYAHVAKNMSIRG